MKNLKFIIVLLVLILSVENETSEYLWIDYNVKLPIKIQSAETFSVTIPCQTRIGDCQAEYSIVPPGWTVQRDGSLIFPQSDAKGYRIYAVRATFSNQFQDRLTADLVCTINNGVFRIYDRKNFLGKNGIEQTSKQNDRPSMAPQINYDIQGFPTIRQLQNLIKNGNIYSVSQKMKQISQKYAPCKAKISYLNQAYILLKQKINENQKIIKQYEDQISTIKNRINTLEEQRKSIDKDLNNDKSYTDMKNNLKALNIKRDNLKINLDKLSFLAERYLTSMYQSNYIGNQTIEEIQLSKLEEEMKAVDKIIQDAVEKKKKLSEQIKVKKSKTGKPAKITKDKQKQLMAIYQSKYRQYSGLALDAKLQLGSIDQQINSVTAKMNIKNADLTNKEQQLTQQMGKLAEYQSPTALKDQQEQENINQIFKLNADNIKDKISILSSSQCRQV